MITVVFIFVLTCLLLLVNSPVNFNMVYTRKKRQQSKKLFSQLSESDNDFMIGLSNREAQIQDRSNAVDESITLNTANISTQINGSQMNMHTLEKNIVNKTTGCHRLFVRLPNLVKMQLLKMGTFFHQKATLFFHHIF